MRSAPTWKEKYRKKEEKQPSSIHDTNPERTVLLSNTAHQHNTATAPRMSPPLSTQTPESSLPFSHYPKEQFFQNAPQSKRPFTSLVTFPKHCPIKLLTVLQILTTLQYLFLNPAITENRKTHSLVDT